MPAARAGLLFGPTSSFASRSVAGTNRQAQMASARRLLHVHSWQQGCIEISLHPSRALASAPSVAGRSQTVRRRRLRWSIKSNAPYFAPSPHPSRRSFPGHPTAVHHNALQSSITLVMQASYVHSKGSSCSSCNRNSLQPTLQHWRGLCCSSTSAHNCWRCDSATYPIASTSRCVCRSQQRRRLVRIRRSHGSQGVHHNQRLIYLRRSQQHRETWRRSRVPRSACNGACRSRSSRATAASATSSRATCPRSSPLCWRVSRAAFGLVIFALAPCHLSTPSNRLPTTRGPTLLLAHVWYPKPL